MELLERTRDYIFAFCLYTLFNAWSIYLALWSQRSLHRSSLFNGIFGGALILYFFFLAIRFTKRTSSRLEKWIGGFTIAICIIEGAKLLFRYVSEPIAIPIERYLEAAVCGVAVLLATVRVVDVIRFGVPARPNVRA